MTAHRPANFWTRAAPRERLGELERLGLNFAAVQASGTRTLGWEIQARDFEICRRVPWIRAVHRVAVRRGWASFDVMRSGNAFTVSACRCDAAGSVEIIVQRSGAGSYGEPAAALETALQADSCVWSVSLPVLGFPRRAFLHVPPDHLPPLGFPAGPDAVISGPPPAGVAGLSPVVGSFAAHLGANDFEIMRSHKKTAPRGRPTKAKPRMSPESFREAVQAARRAEGIEPRDGRGRGDGKPAAAELSALVGLVLVDEVGLKFESANEVHPNRFSDWHDLARAVGALRRRIDALNKWEFYNPTT